MRVTVIGTGYVGLVTGTCFAEMGNNVTCVDNNTAKVAQLKDGHVPIYEPGLEDLFTRNTREGRLRFTDNLKSGIKDAEIIFLALPTNSKENGEADLGSVMSVASELSKMISQYVIIVNKSTVPVGTADKVRDIVSKNTNNKLFDVVSNPEFLREGQAVSDFLKPDRIVIGTNSVRARELMKKLYEPFVRSGHPIIEMSERSAELSKYAANGFLATKISFMNEMANLAERLGANVLDVRRAIGADSRIGDQFLHAGIGYGGSCFPKDVKALAYLARESDYDLEILAAVNKVNERQKSKIVKTVLEHFDNNIKGKTFAVWGLAFKANTDDVRESPAITIIQGLLNHGARIQASDPEAIENARSAINNNAVSYDKDIYEVLNGADALIVATEWRQFTTPDFVKVKKLLKQKIIFDGRNLFNPEEMREQGFYYESIGRATVDGANQ